MQLLLHHAELGSAVRIDNYRPSVLVLLLLIIPHKPSFVLHRKQASEAGSSDYGPEDVMPLMFWPPPAACQAPVTESLDWDIAGVRHCVAFKNV